MEVVLFPWLVNLLLRRVFVHFCWFIVVFFGVPFFGFCWFQFYDWVASDVYFWNWVCGLLVPWIFQLVRCNWLKSLIIMFIALSEPVLAIPEYFLHEICFWLPDLYGLPGTWCDTVFYVYFPHIILVVFAVFTTGFLDYFWDSFLNV